MYLNAQRAAAHPSYIVKYRMYGVALLRVLRLRVLRLRVLELRVLELRVRV